MHAEVEGKATEDKAMQATKAVEQIYHSLHKSKVPTTVAANAARSASSDSNELVEVQALLQCRMECARCQRHLSLCMDTSRTNGMLCAISPRQVKRRNECNVVQEQAVESTGQVGVTVISPAGDMGGKCADF